MSFERYMGVLYPFIHRVEVTKGRLLKCFISICCLQTLLQAACLWFGKPMIARGFFSANMLLFLAFTTFVYAKIYRYFIKKNRSHPGREVANAAQDSAGKQIQFLKELKIAKSCFLVVLSNLVCCLPSIIYLAILSPTPNFHVMTVKKWLYILSMFNSTANSLIFFWRNKELRTEGLKQMRISLDCRLFRVFSPSEEHNDANS
jgi:hypothetical protein